MGTGCSGGNLAAWRSPERERNIGTSLGGGRVGRGRGDGDAAVGDRANALPDASFIGLPQPRADVIKNDQQRCPHQCQCQFQQRLLYGGQLANQCMLVNPETNQLARLPETVTRHTPVGDLKQRAFLDRFPDGELRREPGPADTCDRHQLVDPPGITRDLKTEHGQPALRRPHMPSKGEQCARPATSRAPRKQEHRARHQLEVDIAERPPGAPTDAKPGGVHRWHIGPYAGRIREAAPQADAGKVAMHARLSLCHEMPRQPVIA
jgi:hypothetical protein